MTTSHLDVYATSMTRRCKDVGFSCRRHINVVTKSRFDVYVTSITRRCKDVGFGCRRYINVAPTSHLDIYTTLMTGRSKDVGIGYRRHINVATTSRFNAYITMITRCKDIGFGCRQQLYISPLVVCLYYSVPHFRVVRCFPVLLFHLRRSLAILKLFGSPTLELCLTNLVLSNHFASSLRMYI